MTQEYINTLTQEDVAKMSRAELIRLQVFTGNMPRYLYKYRANDSGTDYIFSENTLYFSPPANFNDPFDCQIISNADNTREEVENFVMKQDPSLKTKSKLLKTIVDAACSDPTQLHNIVNSSIQKVMSNTGVSCFTKNFDNLLMWSHYASSHTGLCLKFDVLEDPALFDAPLEVKYSEDYPSYNHIRNDNTLADIILKTKSEHWKYEEEWRVIKPRHPGVHKFKRTALVEVIFGCKADSNFINKIRTLAKGAGMDHLTYKKAKVSNTEFTLVFENL